VESLLGIRTLGIGIGQLAMHSVREICVFNDGFVQTILSSKVIPIDSSTKLKEAKSI
jgi:aspartyl aminopeptidase